ncbi:Fc.00g085580.m01.CDS01 [Cosmosporella sp. VM-42]
MGAKQRALSEDWLCSAHILLEALPDDGRANLSIGAKASPSETPSKAEVSRWDSGSFEEDPAPTKRHSRIRSMFKFVAKKKSDQHKCDLSMLEPVATTEEQVLHTNKSSTAAGVSKAAIPADQVPPHSPKETPGINTSKYKNDVESILTQIKHPLVPKFVIEDDMKRVGWHQCHAPACQARVISEDVWVCEKHLVQGHFDKDDPPGFMDRPGLGN